MDARISKIDIISTSLSTVSSFDRPDFSFFRDREVIIVMDPATLRAEVIVASTCRLSCSFAVNAMIFWIDILDEEVDQLQ